MDRVLVTAVALVAATHALAACGGTAQRDSEGAIAGSSAIGGQSGGQVGAGGGSSGRAGEGGRAGTGASGEAGLSSVDAGSPPLDAGADSGTDTSVAYRAVITNPLNSGEYVTFTRADPSSNTCVFFTTFVQVGAAPEPVTTASATFGAESCCPYDSTFAMACSTGAGCPMSSSVSGTIGGNPATGFDVDLTIEFSELSMWLPPVVQFRASDLEYSSCN